MLLLQEVGGQGGPGEETQQDGSGAGDGEVRPLVLGLQTQMGSDFLEGDLQLPTQDKPLQDLGRVCRGVGAEESLRIDGALGITQRMVTGGLPERYQTAVWEVSYTMWVAPSYQESGCSTCVHTIVCRPVSVA